MILVYLDESGDTGTNFNDPQQPVFVLGSLLVKQEIWKELEKQYNSIISEAFNHEIPENFELHTMDLVGRRRFFNDFELKATIKLRNQLFQLLKTFKIPVFYRKIEKKMYSKYCESQYGKGIKIDPYIMAFSFIGLQVDSWLKEQNDLGIFIFDEHRSFQDIEQSLRALRLTEDSILQMENVIEKGFFVDSKKSFPLQLIDLVLYYIRKNEEIKIGKKVSEIHKQIFPDLEQLATNLDQHEKGWDILDWIDNSIKK
jgi:hypothetical protein